MRCSIQYCDWQAEWWLARRTERIDVLPELREGLIAYAESHADFERGLAQRWRLKWAKVQTRALMFLEGTHLRGISSLYETPIALASEILADEPEEFTVELDVEDILEDEDEYD